MYFSSFFQILLLCKWMPLSFATNFSTIKDLQAIQSRFALPGLNAVSIARNRSVYGDAVGVRKLGNTTALMSNDFYHLGSNTKAMTATLIALVIANGTLTWNTTLAEALPALKDNINSGIRDVTIAQMASHRSGITGDSSLGNASYIASLVNVPALAGRKDYTAKALALPPTQPVGAFNYSNINYITLGYIIDTHVGPWEDIIKSQLWTPLNMPDCGFGPVPETSQTSIDNPWPHVYDPTTNTTTPWNYTLFGAYPDNPPFFGPAGTVHCRPSSYTKFLSAHLDALAKRSTPLNLTRETWQFLHTPFPGAGTQYCPGAWEVISDDPRSNGPYLWHDGSNSLNYAIATLLPGKDVGYVVFTNTGPAYSELASSYVLSEFFDGDLTLDALNRDVGWGVNGTTTSPSPTSSSLVPRKTSGAGRTFGVSSHSENVALVLGMAFLMVAFTIG